jgi:hypothetical protein
MPKPSVNTQLTLGNISYAIVLVFGFEKVFVPLPPAPVTDGLLATLDPITGEEEFKRVKPVGPRGVPQYIQRAEAMAHLREMHDVLTEDAIARGAKFPPSLDIKELDLGKPDPLWNSTVRYMFPNLAKPTEPE